MSEHTKQVRINKVDSCTLWSHRQLPQTGKSHQRGRQQFQHSVHRYSQHIGAPFGHFQPHHTKVEYKRKRTMGPQTCLTIKHLSKFSNSKLCLMPAEQIGRQRERRNRTKVYVRIKHSMLMLTSIPVNKNKSTYNSAGQKISH